MDWMPIESAPKDGTYIDVWWDGIRLTDVRFDDGEWLARSLDAPILFAIEPTHWMPLPAPPSQEQ